MMAKSREPLEHPWIGDADHPLILGVGRLSRQKDFSALIRAVSKLRETIPVRLMILGGGERRGRLERLITELGLSDVVCLPGFSENPYEFMREADLFVMSSLWEGLDHVLIEAQGVGTIVVTIDCPSGPRESLLDGRLGKIVPVGDHEAMVKAIAASLANREQSD